jgi:hypothetical protein
MERAGFLLLSDRHSMLQGQASGIAPATTLSLFIEARTNRRRIRPRNSPFSWNTPGACAAMGQ